MKISELINALQTELIKHGDVEVQAMRAIIDKYSGLMVSIHFSDIVNLSYEKESNILIINNTIKKEH